MPSWNDGESSTPSLLQDFLDIDYTPDFIEDPSFRGIAHNCPEVCRGHKLEPVRCVAFEGSNTGHRFYLCPLQNEVENYGFEGWVDQEWSLTAKDSLARLWGMYHNCSSARIDERVDNAKLVKELAVEKSKIEKKYTSLVVEVKKIMDDAEKRATKENLVWGKDISSTADKVFKRYDQGKRW